MGPSHKEQTTQRHKQPTQSPNDHWKMFKNIQTKDVDVDIVAGCAAAIVKAVKGSPNKTIPTPNTSVPVGISPGKKAVLSGQYLKQLETIQKLKDNCILSAAEFNNQKERILNNLKSLN